MPLSEPMMTYTLDPWTQISIKSESKYQSFYKHNAIENVDCKIFVNLCRPQCCLIFQDSAMENVCKMSVTLFMPKRVKNLLCKGLKYSHLERQHITGGHKDQQMEVRHCLQEVLVCKLGEVRTEGIEVLKKSFFSRFSPKFTKTYFPMNLNIKFTSP